MSYLAKRKPLEEFLRGLERLFQVNRMYPEGHEQIARGARLAADSLARWGRPVRISLMGEDLMVEDQSFLALGDRMTALKRAFKITGWEGVRIHQGCGPEDLLDWVICASGDSREAYSRGGIVAGGLDLASAKGAGPGGGKWTGSYADYVSGTNESMEELQQLRPEGLERAKEIVRSIAAHLVASGEDLLAAVRALKDSDEYSFTHVLNVSIVSMCMARELSLPKELVEIISLGALCHDVGKAEVPEEILAKPGLLTPEEREIMNRHPSNGGKTLLALQGRVHPLVATIAYQHHMHLDGSGYPRPHAAFRPHPASLLVEVADVFDALRTIRSYRSTLSEEETFTIMLREVQNGRMHRGYVCILLDMFGVFVPGRTVRLADGRTAVVMASGEGDALSPLVETEEADVLDLSDPSMPQITEVKERCD